MDSGSVKSLARRRESSRFAARDRRGKEAEIFADLRLVVPIVHEATVTHVDRIAILRVALTFCRLRKIATKFLGSNLEEGIEYLWSEKTLFECLDGFLAIVDLDGIILYVSESVSFYLGLTQTDLTGRSLKEFVHANDYEEFINCDTSNTDDRGRTSTVRMKAVISPRGRSLNLKNALFKPVVCHMRSLSSENGRIRVIQASAQPAGQGNGIFAASRNTEVQNGTYMTRHTYDMKFSYVSESFNYILRHESRSLMGTSFYNLVHPADLEVVVVSIREMLTKGHTRTPYYRLIGLNKSVLWVQTEANTVTHTAKGQKGQYIICVHQLIGAQNEQDSFTNREDANAPLYPSLMPIKQEMTDNSELMKNSYNEVLQWLFRAQQHSRSPPGTLLLRTENNRNICASCFFGGHFEHCRGPGRYKVTMATQTDTINYGARNGIAVSGASDYVHGNSPNISLLHDGNQGEVFDPFGTQIDLYGLRTSNSQGNFNGEAAGGNTRDCTNQCCETDFSESTTGTIFNSKRLSAASATDACLLSQSGINSGATIGIATESHSEDMLSTLSTPDTQCPRSMPCCDPYINNSFSATATVTTSSSFVLPPNNNSIRTQSNLSGYPMLNCVTEIPPVADKENDSDDSIDGTDDWQMFAPFVAPDDMLQLSTDFQGLLPEFSFADWIPSDPAPLPSLPAEEKGATLRGNVSIPMQMTFDRSTMYTNSNISLLSKPSPFCLTTTSLRQLQQQYQQRHHENMNAGAATATPWLGAEFTAACTQSNDCPSGIFHRNNSAASIQ